MNDRLQTNIHLTQIEAYFTSYLLISDNTIYIHEFKRKLVSKTRKLIVNAHEMINYMQVSIK